MKKRTKKSFDEKGEMSYFVLFTIAAIAIFLVGGGAVIDSQYNVFGRLAGYNPFNKHTTEQLTALKFITFTPSPSPTPTPTSVPTLPSSPTPSLSPTPPPASGWFCTSAHTCTLQNKTGGFPTQQSCQESAACNVGNGKVGAACSQVKSNVTYVGTCQAMGSATVSCDPAITDSCSVGLMCCSNRCGSFATGAGICMDQTSCTNAGGKTVPAAPVTCSGGTICCAP